MNATAFGAPEDESINKTIAKLAPRGIRALGAIASFDPWIGGDTFTLADIVAANTIPLATMVAKKLCNIDLTAELPRAAEWMARINDRDSMKQINADRA